MTCMYEESNPMTIEPAVSHRVSGPLAITHVAVVTMESRQALPDQTVVVENGVIRAIAPSATIDVTGMQIIDGSGKHLMPGLADMHTHITDAGVLRLYLANGVTQVRNLEGLPFHLALARMVEQGTLAGPRLFTVSPLIDGLGAQGLTARPRSLVLTDPAQAEPMAQRLVKRGYREMKAYQWLTLDALGALGRAAAHVGVRMAGHCPDGITFEQAMAAGMGCFEHLTGIAAGHLRGGRQFPSLRDTASRLGNRDALELVAHHLDFDAIRRLAHTMATNEVWNCPTLVVWQKQNQEPDVALADPDLQYEHPGAVRAWEKLLKARYAALPCPLQEWLALARGRDEALAKVVAILHEEGAPLLLGTDAPNPFVVHGCSIHQELANLVRAGLSPYEALRCGTVEAARFLGESAASGSVAVGKRADLLLLQANPLTDVGAVRELEAVFVNGFYLTRADLDGLLEHHLASLAAPPPVELSEFTSDLDDVEGEIVRQGTLQEWFSEMRIGLASYRHARFPDGGWQVEERSARSGPRGPQQRTVRMWLGPDWSMRRAEIETATDVGRESSKIIWSDGAYRVRVTQPDGYSSDSTITSAPLPPSERLAFSAPPQWLASQSAPVAASLLGIEHEVAQVAGLSAEPVAGQIGEPGIRWQVSIARPGEVSTQTYCLAEDGALLRLRDTLFGTPRELVAESHKSNSS
ncbi:MAG: amidohydrolase family protein [Blastocatellia bacterium]